MRRKLALLALVGLFWVTPQPVSADPVVLFFSRTTIAGAQVGGTFTEDIDSNADVLTSSASTGVGAASAGAASTFTSILAPDSRSLSGAGVAQASVTAPEGSAVAYGSGQTHFDFLIDQPHTYTFVGAFATGVTGYSVWETYLIDRTSRFFEFREDSAVARSSTGTLLPGRYVLVVLGRATAGCGFGGESDCTSNQAFTSFSFDFQLSPETEAPAVPEPASMILLGTGLAGVFATRRRHGRP
jgi:hypothetical protein